MGTHWLPDRHLGVAATLAHVDEIIAAVGEMLFEYQTGRPASSSVVRLREQLDGGLRHLVVDAVDPIPQKVPLLAADALNGLRAALEHTIYIEAAAHAGGELPERAAKLVEMPAASTEDEFAEWTRKRARHGPTALQNGAELHRRIHDLQPLHRYSDPAAHPLARLVSYTNRAKHRTPAVTAVRIPVVSREDVPPRYPSNTPKQPESPIELGQILFTAPADQVVPLAVYPTVGINLPGTDLWPVLMKELGDIAAWVRIQAIPRLISGIVPQKPEIPAWYDISQGHSDRRAAMSSGTCVPAFDRKRDRLMAATARMDMKNVIAAIPGAPSPACVLAWLESMPDTEVLSRMREIVLSLHYEPAAVLHNWDVLQRMRDDAAAFAATCS